ncbi:zinc finger protein 513-like [Cimex lectularius]|uniref:C2H2-type domain-containing protein n=1 Tax=Cimex lectularius TaxID=79782 RepID=A0A8I6S2K0_CIMLE|nr:zinc finger protein 513-like [Cimex lectularius]
MTSSAVDLVETIYQLPYDEKPPMSQGMQLEPTEMEVVLPDWKNKVFGCAACSYSTDVASRLERHMRRHTGEKPYACKECSYRGTDAGLLKRHMRTHTGEKPFSCSLCEYRCAQACTLKEHMMVHTGKKPFVCSECDYQCSRACRLKIHMLKHTGVKLENVQGSSKSNWGHKLLTTD